MKRFIILLTFLFLSTTSCTKDPSLKGIVFKGKYIGRSCWPVIQVLEPSLSSVGLDPEETIWRQKSTSGNDTLYQDALGAQPIPVAFMTGDPFYFTVNKIESHPDIITNGNCLRTKYIVTIKKISFIKSKL